jgi:deazaflavin-dependent oxidoreductase (nitroreductase family)
MARFNRALVNPVAVHVAGLVPGMGLVTHVGRRSRTVYRTPVLVFRTKDGYRIALTYGRDSEWVKNALAHGAVRLTTKRRQYELSVPRSSRTRATNTCLHPSASSCGCCGSRTSSTSTPHADACTPAITAASRPDHEWLEASEGRQEKSVKVVCSSPA